MRSEDVIRRDAGGLAFFLFLEQLFMNLTKIKSGFQGSPPLRIDLTAPLGWATLSHQSVKSLDYMVGSVYTHRHQ